MRDAKLRTKAVDRIGFCLLGVGFAGWGGTVLQKIS